MLLPAKRTRCLANKEWSPIKTFRVRENPGVHVLASLRTFDHDFVQSRPPINMLSEEMALLTQFTEHLVQRNCQDEEGAQEEARHAEPLSGVRFASSHRRPPSSGQ
jgi:hypothetical protein